MALEGTKLEGILLIGEKYRDEVRTTLEDNGFEAVFDDRDKIVLPNLNLYEIRLNEYFKGY